MFSETKYRLSEIAYLEKPSNKNNGLPEKQVSKGTYFSLLKEPVPPLFAIVFNADLVAFSKVLSALL